MEDETERFAHGAFWDQYSRRWETDVGPRIEGEILGEEWTRPERTRFITERFALPYLSDSARVVEIGPGGGKFSRKLVERCHELLLVDISREMLQRANAALGGRAREVLIEDGAIAAIESSSVDLVFSYDVFIHLESEEVFRYFAEVNRLLKTGGVFSVHTSSFESRWGLHSYFQQLRDHQPLIGRRYGGRMYPMTAGILRRFAQHSGFAVVDSHVDRKDKDLLFAFRKTRPARPWAFVTRPDLYQRYELSERVGGSDSRELYAARSLESAQLLVLALGDPEDSLLVATAEAQVPRHPCLARPLGLEVFADVGIVRFAGSNPQEMAERLGARGRASERGLLKAAGKLLEGLLEAHAAGLAHGELGPEFILADGDADRLVIFGLVERAALPAGDSCHSDPCCRDLAAMASILTAAAAAGGSDALAESAGELEGNPVESLATDIARQCLS